MPPVTEAIDEFVPTTQAELSRFMRDNAHGERRPLIPVGGRTALHYGYPPAVPGISVPLARLNRVVDYPARDMTVTVEAGLRIDELAALLATERQQLPIDVPQSNRATIGGVVACDVSGPRRFGYGTLRDYVIGVSAVDAKGRLFSAGGRVVKNVAGYDLCKLLVGSLGTLAVITQLTLKLKPVPESTALLWATFDTFAEIDMVLDRLLTSATRPVAVEVLNPDAAKEIAADSRRGLPTDQLVLAIGVEGAAADVTWQLDRLTREIAPLGPDFIEVVPEAEHSQVWAALTEFSTESDAPLTFQANLLPSATMEFCEAVTRQGIALQAHAANGIVIGQLPDGAATVEKAAAILTPLRAQARQARGNLTVLNCDNEWKPHLPLFGDAEPSWPLMRKLKQQLDPNNLLNPGRFIDHIAAP